MKRPSLSWRNAFTPAVLLAFAAASVCLGDDAASESGLGERMTSLVLQLGAIMIAARLGGFICKRYLHVPDVLGELGAGILIGPYLLGPTLGLFEPAAGAAVPVSPELYAFATVASILLLYLAGLETDVGMFLRYSVVGSLVGVGGVAVSFMVGTGVAVWTHMAPSYGSPQALFMGAISTATSVGISARVLSQRNKLDSPEGVTILAGAVVDDVLGIVILAVVVGMAKTSVAGAGVNWRQISLIAGKALGFWIGCTGLGMLMAKRVSRVLEFFGSRQTMATLSFGLALLMAGLAEKANLAMIIGAYIMGLSMSRVDASHELRARLEPVCDTLVAVFFTVMGMMVNLQRVNVVLAVGIIYTLAGVAAKIVGCGLPALAMRFNPLGALRVGVGMLPRGEVTLLMAGLGLAGGFISQDMFSVAVLMTLASTLLAPLIMQKLFDDRPGVRNRDDDRDAVQHQVIAMRVPNPDVAGFLLDRLQRMCEAEDCYVHQLGHENSLFQIRRDDMVITARYENQQVLLTCGPEDREFARLMLLEALAGLISIFEGLRTMQLDAGARSQISV